MKLDQIFGKPTKEQLSVFNTVAPIIERHFPKAFCFTDWPQNKISFELKYDVRKNNDTTLVVYPDKKLLDKVYNYLLYLAIKQNSKIHFVLMCDEYGNGWGIEANW